MHLNHVISWNIERGQDIEAAMLMGSFTRYLYRDLDKVVVPTRPGFHEHVETTFDRLHGGCLFLSFTALAVLEDLVDWDRWGEEGGGVFNYEHLEASDDQPFTEGTDLAAFLLREIPAPIWYEIAENWDVPNEAELIELLTRWCRACKLPLVGDEAADDGESALAPLILVSPAEPERRCDSLPYDFEDFGLTRQELQDKYAAEQEHPEYTNQRWGVEAPTKPYWDWVMDHIAEDDDETE
jgi:hypothetical protein